jgi:site-specific recombinase XerD
VKKHGHFAGPDLKSKDGRRDYALMTFMDDTAARVQEIADLKMRHIRLAAPAVVTLHGKGDKTRQVPILDRTRNMMTEYMDEQKNLKWGIAFQDVPVFFNQRRQPLSRWGVSYKKSLVDALLDRLKHRCITIKIDGPSLSAPSGKKDP